VDGGDQGGSVSTVTGTPAGEGGVDAGDVDAGDVDAGDS
jgi:hypothetical protein